MPSRPNRPSPRHARRTSAGHPLSSRLVAFALTLALGAAAAPGCGEDKPGTPPAADAGPTPPCKPADCQGIPLPGGMCPAGTTPTFTCARSQVDLRCAWTLGRCTNDDALAPAPDAADDVPGDVTIDTPTDLAADATDDAPADAGADAPDDGANTDTAPPDGADADDATVD